MEREKNIKSVMGDKNNMIRIIIGSKNDQQYLNEAEKIFKDLSVSYKIHVYSCHRSLKELTDFLDTIRSEKNKTDVVIAIANSVTNLPAVVAGYLKESAIPVIGVGLSGKRMDGIDSLLSVATIPRRVPLMNTGIDDVGIYNAILACLNILAIKDRRLAKKISKFYDKIKK